MSAAVGGWRTLETYCGSGGRWFESTQLYQLNHWITDAFPGLVSATPVAFLKKVPKRFQSCVVRMRLCVRVKVDRIAVYSDDPERSAMRVSSKTNRLPQRSR